jgi:hypothetical protein
MFTWKKKWERVISFTLGVKPLRINSNLVSAQNRKRLYWTNIPNINQPIDLNITIKDYIGIIDNGISVILSIKYNENFYEGLYWYDYSNKILTIEDSLEEEIGPIISNIEYDNIINYLISEVPPYKSLRDKLPVLK